jgi:hypothetical protein
MRVISFDLHLLEERQTILKTLSIIYSYNCYNKNNAANGEANMTDSTYQ